MISADQVPTYKDLLWPTLRATSAQGGSATKDEIDSAVIEREGYTEEQQQVLKGDGPQTLLLDRLSWARSYLKGMGLMHNPRRGIWTVTELGEAAEEADIWPLHAEYMKASKERSRNRGPREIGMDVRQPPEEVSEVINAGSVEGASGQGDWKELLLDRLQRLDPTAFEFLAQRVLREAGFSRVTVTRQSNDGGIDGLGVYQLSLLSFPVYFQCKRYVGSVGSSAIRDFRGAMAGRGDKGLLITTGSFTAEAQREAKREGAQPIDLIDGDALCDLLRDLQLGVQTVERVVEDVTVVASFFDNLEKRNGRFFSASQAGN